MVTAVLTHKFKRQVHSVTGIFRDLVKCSSLNKRIESLWKGQDDGGPSVAESTAEHATIALGSQLVDKILEKNKHPPDISSPNCLFMLAYTLPCN